jgi:hypothetical protein
MPAFAVKRVVTQTRQFNPYYTPQAYYGGDYIPSRRFTRQTSSKFRDINDLERYALNKNFTKDSDKVRLERLETLAFGAVQEGDIYTRYDNVRNAILTRPKPNYKTSVLRNISDYFNGQLTGFTPSVNSTSLNNYFPSDFGKSYDTGYSTPWGKGYRTENYGTGSGIGVHILD